MITLGSTVHFVVEYDDGGLGTNGQPRFPDAQRIGQIVLATAERDLAKLETLFGFTGIFDGGNHVFVRVVDLSTIAANGTNAGFITAPAYSRIEIHGNALQGATGKRADEVVGDIFAHELSEVLMDYGNQTSGATTWHASRSDGDGLARECGYWCHAAFPPDFTDWMSGARDTASLAQPASDRNFIADKGTFLFLEFLRLQLRIPLASIIAHGGANPEQTYTNLTGQSGGGPRMVALLDRFYPRGIPLNIRSGGPFPLLDPPERQAHISFEEGDFGSSTESEGKVNVQPAAGCPSQKYAYAVVNRNATATFTVVVTGMADPVFSWRINGITIADPSTHNGTSVPMLVNAMRDVPQHPFNPTPEVAKVTLRAIVFDSSTLVVDAYRQYVGGFRFGVELRVSERYAANGETIAFGLGELRTQIVEYGEAFWRDRGICLAVRADWAKHHQERVPMFRLLLTLPDPPPAWARVTRALEEAYRELDDVARENPVLASELATVLEARLQLPQRLQPPLRAANPDEAPPETTSSPKRD